MGVNKKKGGSKKKVLIEVIFLHKIFCIVQLHGVKTFAPADNFLKGEDNNKSFSRAQLFRVTSSDLHNNTMDVTFEMKDIDCPWWKSGLALDFVQLEKKC